MSSPLVSILPPFSPPGLPKGGPTMTVTTLQRPANTNGVSGTNGNPLASAALYLYTFLATLVLLIGISLFVIIRSIIQRQRRNRAVREAWLRYTNGSIPFHEGDLDLIRFVEFRMNQSAVGARGGRVDLNKVPTMWEAHLSQKKSIDSEKTTEGKLISSSWKLHQRSIPYLDLKSSISPYWAWSSILPLSSTLLPPDEVAASKDDTSDFPTMSENLQLRGVRWFFGRMLNGSASGRGTPVYDQRRPHAPASASDSIVTTNPSRLFSSSPHPDNRNRHRTDTGDEAQHEEGTLHLRLSGSNSHPHTNMDQTPPVTITSTTTEFTHPSPGQGAVGDAHISSNIPQNPHPSRNQISNPSQIHPLSPNQESSSGTVDKSTRMRVAVLVRMPTPPTPSPHSWLSKAESKAKAVSGYEIKDSTDEKRSSSFSRSTASTLGGGERRDDTDTDEVLIPPLEVGLADVDVFPDCCDGTIGER